MWLGPLVGTQIAGTTVGDCLAIFAGYFLLTDPGIKWQYYVITMSAPLVLFLILAPFFLVETPQYYMVKGENEKAVEVLRKIAKQNGEKLPDEVNVVLRKKHEKKPVENHWRLFFKTVTNWTFVKVLFCILMISAGGRIINDGINFIMADLLYIDGESGSYCHGTQSQTYFLRKSDYLKLFMSQVSSFLTVFIAYPLLWANISVKMQSICCFALCGALVSVLYACPSAQWAFALLSVVRIMMQVINICSVNALVQLHMPTQVRGTVLGFSTSLRTAPLPFYPLLSHTLSKKSQHYVTTVTMTVMVLGFLAAVFLPREINKQLLEQEEAENKKFQEEEEKAAEKESLLGK